MSTLFNEFISAIRMGDCATVKELYKDEYRDSCHCERQMRALHFASIGNNLDLVKYLVEKCGDINVLDATGMTPLHYACMFGSFDIVKYLVENGGDINRKDRNGKGPLLCSFRCGKFDIVKYLVGNGCDINAVDNFGRVPVHHACTWSKLDVVKYMVGNGCDINAVDNLGRGTVHFAFQNKNIDVAKYLLDEVCVIDINDAHFRSIYKFIIKLRNPHLDSLLLLMSHNYDIRDTYVSPQRNRDMNEIIDMQIHRQNAQMLLEMPVTDESYEYICTSCNARGPTCVLTCGHVSCYSCIGISVDCSRCHTKMDIKWKLFFD